MQAPVPPQSEVEDDPIHNDGPVEPAPAGSEVSNKPISNYSEMDVGLLAQIAIEHSKFGVHVAEICSPPRVTALASKVNLNPGIALDLTQVDAETGKPLDYSDPQMSESMEAAR